MILIASANIVKAIDNACLSQLWGPMKNKTSKKLYSAVDEPYTPAIFFLKNTQKTQNFDTKMGVTCLFAYLYRYYVTLSLCMQIFTVVGNGKVPIFRPSEIDLSLF